MKYTSAITVQLLEASGDGDLGVVAAAKVSTVGALAAESVKPEAAAGLIRYLMQHRHGTPFEHNSFRFLVHAPIFVFREWHRHRIGWCLAGDTEITLETPNPKGRVLRRRTIAEIYQNWKIGVQDRDAFQSVPDSSLHTSGLYRSVATRGGKQTTLGYFKHKDEADRVAGEWRDANPTRRTRQLPACKHLRARVLNEQTQLFEIGRMADVYQSGVKPLYQIKTETGKTLRASRDHRVLTQDGWCPLGEIRGGDRVAVVGRRSMFAERQIPPSLRRGIGVWTSMQRTRLIREEDQCYVCGRRFVRALLELDHVVPVVADLTKALDIQNLKPICEFCHAVKSEGEQRLARRGCTAGSRYVRVVQSPELVGEGMTYDIAMEGPHHNFVANGIVVHNSYNEESGRYKTLEPVFYLPPPERPSAKVDGWKPGRPRFDPTPPHVHDAVCQNLRDAYAHGYAAYVRNLELGIDPGLARDCLPVGIYSSMYATCNARSLMAFLSLRTHDPEAARVSYPLWEIEQAALQMEMHLEAAMPFTAAAFREFGRTAP